MTVGPLFHSAWWEINFHGPLTRYVKLRVAHAPGMPGTFSATPRVSDPYMHHGMCVTHVPWCMLGSLTTGFLWSRWRVKHSRHSSRMRNPQFYVSGKRPMASHFADVNNITHLCCGLCQKLKGDTTLKKRTRQIISNINYLSLWTRHLLIYNHP